MRFFKLGQEDERNRIFGQAFSEGLQGIASVFAGFAVGNVDFQQFQIGKQTCAAGTLQQFVPVKIVFGSIDFAVEIALFFCGCAQRIQSLDAQQILFAVNNVQRFERRIGAQALNGRGSHYCAFRKVRRRTI